MRKNRLMPKGLQIYMIKKALRKEIKDIHFDAGGDIDAEIFDNLDFDSLVDSKGTYGENLERVKEYVEKNFGNSLKSSEQKTDYEEQIIDREIELKNFREKLRMESGFDLADEDFTTLLELCSALIPIEKKVVSQKDEIKKVEDSRITELVGLLKPNEPKAKELPQPNITTIYIG